MNVLRTWWRAISSKTASGSNFENRLAKIRDVLLKRAVPVIPIDAGEPVPAQVQKHLGQTISSRRAGKQ